MTTPLRLLLLVDQDSDAELMLNELRSASFDPEWRRVQTERDYLDALSPRVDVIVATYAMQKFTVLRALERLRECDLDVPFIVVSGATSEEIAVECMKKGAADYLPKDRLTRLGPAVVETLEQKRLRDADRRALVALRESEERYRHITEHVTDGIFVIDLDGRLVFGNRSGEELTGYTFAEFVGRPIFSLLTAESAEVAMTRLARLQTGKSVPPTFEAEVVRKDRSTIFVEAHIANLLKDGRVVGRLGVFSNISVRKRAEEALRLLDSAVRQAGESIMITTAELDLPGPGIVFVNPAFTKMTGYTADEVIGRTPRILQGPRSDRAMLRRLRDALSASREFYGETINYRKDRTPFPIALHITPVRDEHGRVTHFIGIQRDLTEQKRAEAQFAGQQEALFQSEKLATMGQLLAGVAHELNNPLAVIVGRTALLREHFTEGPFATQIEKISAAGERGSRIVRNFLALARQQPPERRETDLNTVVQDAVELLAYQLRVDGVELAFDLDEIPRLWADPHQLSQVVLNLVSNAQQAMHDGPGPRRITLSTRFEAVRQAVTLTVAATGPGIPKNVRARIFEPFFTTKPAGQGTGLGLSLCHGIAEAHGGRISLDDNAPGSGAAFRVELPLRTVFASSSIDDAGQPAPASAAVRTILVVDDDEEVAAVIADILTADGHDVDTTRNGAEALEKLGVRRYDAVLSDLRMPGMDGMALYCEIGVRYPALLGHIAFITGDTLSEQIDRFL